MIIMTILYTISYMLIAHITNVVANDKISINVMKAYANVISKHRNPRISFQIDGIHTFPIWCKVQAPKVSPKPNIHDTPSPPC
jgi:hypothetical protein